MNLTREISKIKILKIPRKQIDLFKLNSVEKLSKLVKKNDLIFDSFFDSNFKLQKSLIRGTR